MIEKIIITSLVVMAIWATMWEGAIFGFVREKGEELSNKNRNLNKIIEKISKPIYDCPVCMVPYYGSTFYWLYYRNNWIEWVVVIIAAMGLNAVLVKLFPDD